MSQSASRNLLILHTEGSQELSDWQTVQKLIAEAAPDIEVRIGNNSIPSSITRKWQIKRPSLVFSPLHLMEYRPQGGKVYTGIRMTKLDEGRRMADAGLPVPHFMKMMPGMALNRKRWGDHVIVKPTYSSLGRGVVVCHTEDVATQYARLVNNSSDEFMVQRFVDHTDEDGHLNDYRALMLFGRPLYLHHRRWPTPRPPLDQLATTLSSGIASNSLAIGRDRRLSDDADVLQLAAKVCAAFQEIPVLAIDIIRERSTGNLYVLEVNSGGNTWHFSSDMGKKHFTNELRLASYRQFDALRRTADLLIERTRAEAK